MAERRPLVLASAVVRELPSGDVVPVAAGGTGATTADGARTNLGGVTAAHGFEGRSGSSLSMTGTVLTLSVPSSQVVWLDGVRYVLTSDLTIDLGASPAVGNHSVVAQDDGNGALELSASQSAWSITNTSYTPCALIYWNGTAGAVMEERHGHDRNLAQHAYLHSTRGAAIENDGSFAQTRPTTTYDAQIELVAGSLWDEDIENLISTAQGKLCRHWYETASNTWTWVNGTDNGGYDRPFLWNSGTSRVQFPESDNSYALADAGPGAFVPVWVYASNDVTRPIYVVTPALTAAYNTLGAARAATAPVLPFTPELKLLYRWIIRGDGQYQEAADYRTSSSLPGGGVTAPTAASVSFNPSGDLAATNVQAALEELDTEKAPAAKGVTNGDSHDHNGGDGAQIAYSSLSGLPTLGTAAATASTDYAPAAKGVTNGDSHDHNGGDGAQIAYSSLSGTPTLGTAAAAATTDFAAASHAHGNITAAGAIGSTANLPVITTTSGALTVGAFGTEATNFCAGNDARLSDARTPTAHNQAETTITFTDVSTGNASTTAHGFAPKATAPASGLRSVLAIDNGETVRSDKALFDATNPAALGTASPGSAMTAARRDHVHALPNLGKILQVVAATSTTVVTVASGTYTDIGLSVTITPRDANSKILLLASFEVYVYDSGGGDAGAGSRLLRGSTVVQEKFYSPWAKDELIATVSYAGLDSPATASATTYKLQGKVTDYVSGKAVNFMDAGSSGSLIALEVAG